MVSFCFCYFLGILQIYDSSLTVTVSTAMLVTYARLAKLCRLLINACKVCYLSKPTPYDWLAWQQQRQQV